MRKFIAVTLAAIVAVACSNRERVVDMPTSVRVEDRIDHSERSASIQRAKWEKALIVGAADMGGAYGGAKAGAWIGGVFGPKGAVLGGVVGCIIGGCGASLEASGIVVPRGSTRNLNLAAEYFRGFPSSSDSIGWIHNDFVRRTYHDHYVQATFPSKSELYDALSALMVSRGYDEREILEVFPLQMFIDVVTPFKSVESMDDILVLMRDDNLLVDSFWRKLLNELRATSEVQEALEILARYRLSIDTLSIDQTSKTSLRDAITVGCYSLSLWNANN
ncbi:MAG: hypothetical protein RL594_1169 [Bacteroidota bacterium]|jgi:hypothetical protein